LLCQLETTVNATTIHELPEYLRTGNARTYRELGTDPTATSTDAI